MTDLSWVERPDGLRIACRHLKGHGPMLVFLPGYMSDMEGGKALALWQWAQANGRAMLRLDYGGCGLSAGQFEEQTLDQWRDDILLALDRFAHAPVVLVGSSMGGWLMLLAALARPEKVAGLIGIAAAPDFTQWGFDEQERAILARDGRLERASEYGDQPMVTSAAFFRSGHANHLLCDTIAIDCPVRLLHGQCDPDVPWQISVTLAERLRSRDVQTWLVKDGDHRLSRAGDLALLCAVADQLMSVI